MVTSTRLWAPRRMCALLLLLLIFVVATIALHSAVAQSPSPAPSSIPAVPSFDPVPISVKAPPPPDWTLTRPLPPKDRPTTGRELVAFLRKYERLELFRVFSSSPTPFMNPQVGVTVTLSKNGTPKDILAEMVTEGQKALALPDFRIIRESAATSFNGTPAAKVEYSYSHIEGRGKYTLVHRTWLIPRSELTFVVAASVRQDDMETVAKDLDIILQSIMLGAVDLSR